MAYTEDRSAWFEGQGLWQHIPAKDRRGEGLQARVKGGEDGFAFAGHSRHIFHKGFRVALTTVMTRSSCLSQVSAPC